MPPLEGHQDRRAERLVSMALTKADMAESLFNKLGLNKRESRELVDLYFEELTASLAVGENYEFSSIGAWLLARWKAVVAGD